MSARRTIYWFKLGKRALVALGIIGLCVELAVVDSLPSWFLAAQAGALGVGFIVWLVVEEMRRLRDVEMGR